jgi:hypothetical protein
MALVAYMSQQSGISPRKSWRQENRHKL